VRRLEVLRTPFALRASLPALVLGQNYWDHCLVLRALTLPVPVIDCSRGVIAVHQIHDYAYSLGGSAGTHGGRTCDAQQSNWWEWRTVALHQKRNAHPPAWRKNHAGAALQQVGVDFGAVHSSGILGTYVLAAKAISSAQGDLHEVKEYVEIRGHATGRLIVPH
jgi:hypothetical protein